MKTPHIHAEAIKGKGEHMNERDYVLAKQAGFVEYGLEDYTESGNDIRFSRFAELIRADEREACAKVCDSLEEQCEKLLVPDEKWPTPSDCAHIIRARGNT
jgi:hypothetical protein